MKRKAVTIIEVVVCIAILLIFCSLVFGRAGCTGYYEKTGTGVYQCVKTYTVVDGGGDSTKTHKRVDLRPQNGGLVETMNVDDDFMMGQYNSATIYAQLEQGKWYSVDYTGYRREGVFSFFPNVTKVTPVPDPQR